MKGKPNVVRCSGDGGNQVGSSIIEINGRKKADGFHFSAGEEKIVNNKARRLLTPLPPARQSGRRDLGCTRDNTDNRKKIGQGEGGGKCFIGPSQKPMSCP